MDVMKFRTYYQLPAALFLLLAFAANSISQRPTAGGRPPRQEKLLNGLRIATWSDSAANKVSLKLRIHAGSAFDPRGKEGLTALLAETFFPSPESREYFSTDIGGSFKQKTTYDYIEINASSDPENFLTMLESIADAVTSPNFEKEVLDAVKARLAADRSELEIRPDFAADTAAAQRLFGEFPYGRPVLGSDATMAAIDFVDLRNQFTRVMGADNASLAIAGNFKSDLALRAIRRYFGAWAKADAKVPVTFKQPDTPPTSLLQAASPKPGIAEIRFASRGFARGSNDFIASEILTAIFEERMRANTPAEYRNSIFVRNDAYILPGSMVFGITGIINDRESTTDSQPKIEANDIMTKTLGGKISADEFLRAKSKVEQKFSQMDAASRWLDTETYKLSTMDTYSKALTAVTAADVQKAADKIAAEPIVSVLIHTAEENQ